MICCLTGHRSRGFPFPRDKGSLLYDMYIDNLSNEIYKLIQSGYDHYISGMAEGADIDFADTVLYFRDIEKESITLKAALPYPVSPQKRITEYGFTREEILSLCDQKHIVSQYYHRGCMQKRNRYMVDKSDIVLAVWNGSFKGAHGIQ